MGTQRPRLLEHLHWLGHDSFRIDRPAVVYLDPWKLAPGAPAADVILISHDHYDHCSPEDVDRLRKPGTVVIANASAAAKLAAPVTVLRPGEETTAAGVKIRALPAYNIGKKFHPKESGHVGYLLTLGDESLYFAGDTDRIPEMKGLVCDVALLPVSGVYTMTAEEAAQAAGDLRARVVVPMHFGAGVAGEPEDAERFRRLSPVTVEILPVEGGA